MSLNLPTILAVAGWITAVVTLVLILRSAARERQLKHDLSQADLAGERLLARNRALAAEVDASAADVARITDELRRAQHVSDIYRAGVETRLRDLERVPVPGDVRRVLREIVEAGTASAPVSPLAVLPEREGRP